MRLLGKVEVLMYLKEVTVAYLLMIGIIILYCIIFFANEEIKTKQKKQNNNKMKQLIQKELKKKNVSAEHVKYLQKNLRTVKNLFLWEDILLEEKKKKDNHIIKYCQEISPAFSDLTNYYREKDSIEKAYFTHVLSKFPEIIQNEDNKVQYAMMQFVFDPSVYCRENAMLFFYQKGSVNQVINSLKKISKRNLYYSPRLLADDLLKFTGNKEELSDALLKDFDIFNKKIQLAIINYLRFSKCDRRVELYEKLKKQNYDKEVILAIIRYFRVQIYKPVRNILFKIMEDKKDYNYEYRLVAAYTLSSYDDAQTRTLLVEGLKDKNWFVRKNSALSLARMQLTKEEQNQIFALNDRYAKEMMQYILEETKQIRKESRNGELTT